MHEISKHFAVFALQFCKEKKTMFLGKHFQYIENNSLKEGQKVRMKIDFLIELKLTMETTWCLLPSSSTVVFVITTFSVSLRILEVLLDRFV